MEEQRETINVNTTNHHISKENSRSKSNKQNHDLQKGRGEKQYTSRGIREKGKLNNENAYRTMA